MNAEKNRDIAWSPEYDIGIARIDKAHREIFQIVSLLVEKNMAQNREAIVETANFMRDYVLRHFKDEEEYMAEISYANLEAHSRYHREFREKILPAIDRKMVESNYDQESVDEFVDLLVAWLRQHIMISDRKIKEGQG